MDINQLQQIAFRQHGLLIINPVDVEKFSPLAANFCTRMRKLGYVVDEKLLHALNGVDKEELAEIYRVVKKSLDLGKNWSPLVKGWLVPTGENALDHLITLFVNAQENAHGSKSSGVRLPCGHVIPEGTFPLERYNGCPFCGTPFELSDEVFVNQSSKSKVLTLWTLDDMKKFFMDLLASPVPLDATQREDLFVLLANLPFPKNPKIVIKETAMLAIDVLIEQERYEEAAQFIASPDDVIRYLWYVKTSMIQVIKPSLLIRNAVQAVRGTWQMTDVQLLEKRWQAGERKREELKLSYDRRMCRIVAGWLNNLKMSPRQAAEIMHPKRGMWVRFIRALRLTEFAKKKGYDYLKTLLDVFYRKDYAVFQGQVDELVRSGNFEQALALLQQRPGAFARQLFSLTLRSGNPDLVIGKFAEIADKLPPRLLTTLGMYAELYFDITKFRTVKTILGTSKEIDNPKLLYVLSDKEMQDIVGKVQHVYVQMMYKRFANTPTEAKTVYIDLRLLDIPVSIGERSTTIQDASCALPGTRFDVEGDTVRIFMQWGEGLPAQHLDMDLSARILYKSGRVDDCSYYNLSFEGARHSGDIRSIPDKVGTAEYVNLTIPTLRRRGAKYVVFTCNAYSTGIISPNLVVGWMNSRFPMKVSEKTGVAYDPSCVDHKVRISEANAARGLVFGVLDIDASKVIWLEMPYGGQIASDCDLEEVEGVMRKLSSRTSIGDILLLKVEAQHLELVESPEKADEVYDYNWALSTAQVSKLLFG